MKYIEDLRDIHKGEEIWVIGSGPSLDDYPIDFFKDKICIGVNWVFSTFLDMGDGLAKFSTRIFYSLHSHSEHADWIAKNIPHFLTNCFLISHPHRMFGGFSYCRPSDFNEDPYWIRNSFGVSRVRATDATFRLIAKSIMEKRSGCSYHCRGTTLHWAIEVAAVLGAKKIYLVGASATGGRMRKHGSRYPKDHHHGLIGTWRSGNKSLAVAFRPYGVKIVYYYYDKGEQEP